MTEPTTSALAISENTLIGLLLVVLLLLLGSSGSGGGYEKGMNEVEIETTYILQWQLQFALRAVPWGLPPPSVVQLQAGRLLLLVHS